MLEASENLRDDHGNGRICVLLNARSGKSDDHAGRRGEIEEAFANRGIAPQIVNFDPGADLKHMVRKAVDEGHSTIVAGGGDGTICGVAEALTGTDCKLGILPRGTFNYFARSLDIPLDAQGAVDVIADGFSRPLRVATMNGEVFLNNANFGMYPHILRTREEIYDKWGRSRIAAYWSVLKSLVRWQRPLAVEIAWNGQTRRIRTPMLFVFNNAFQLRQMGMEGDDCIEDGRLALLFAPDCGRMGLVSSSIAILLGRAQRHKDFELICGTDFEIRTKRKRLHVARDGERAKRPGPLRIALSEDPLELIVPKGAREHTR